MKFTNSMLAAALAVSAAPADAQNGRSGTYSAPQPARVPYPDNYDRGDASQPDQEELMRRGYEYAQKNYKRLLSYSDRQTQGDRFLATDPYNSRSLPNRGLDALDPGKLGGGLGRVFRDFGVAGGNNKAGLQKQDNHDNLLAPSVIAGFEANMDANRAAKDGNRGEAERLGRIADDQFLQVGTLLFKFDVERDRQRGTRFNNGLGRTLNRVLGR